VSKTACNSDAESIEIWQGNEQESSVEAGFQDELEPSRSVTSKKIGISDVARTSIPIVRVLDVKTYRSVA
jgi:hypothetical protein